MSITSEFWSSVNDARQEIRAALQDPIHALQPKDGTVFIISLKNRIANTVAGSISLATIALAGQRCAEGSHKLASAEEITAYRAEEVAIRQRLNRQEIARRQQTVFEAS